MPTTDRRGTPGTRLGAAEWLLLLLAVAIAHVFYGRILLYPSAFDAQSYLDIATDIARHGVARNYLYAAYRPYGYPLLLAGLLRIAEATGASWGLLIFEAQLGLHLLGALFVRGALLRMAAGPAGGVFAALVLNPFVLSYTPETLTESLAVSLTTLAAAFWIRLLLADDAARQRWAVFLGSLLVGFGVVVRPAQVFLLVSWVVAVAALHLVRRSGIRAVAVAGALSLAGLALPILPQMASNLRSFGVATPLVTAPLGRYNQLRGVMYLKTASGLPPVAKGQVAYWNPFSAKTEIDQSHPLSWYRAHPAAGALTLALHVFNLTDQDLLFTYSRDLDPWYRVPVGVFNHAAVALSLWGLALLGRQALRGGSRELRLGVGALLLLIVSHLVVYAPTGIDMRYGLTLLALALPLAVWALRTLARAGRRVQALAALCVLGYVIGALALSGWVREQAPAIRAWKAAAASRR